MSEEADSLLADNLPDPAMIAALIPLVQGRFLLQSRLAYKLRSEVLIPLIQGRFLFGTM